MIELRAVVDEDLLPFYEFQLDPVAAAMAAFGSRAKLEDHLTHWRTKILADPAATARTVVVDGLVAGNVLSWLYEGKRYVGYWIGREFWGRGVGTHALRLFVDDIPDRPLHALVVLTNVASQRVLEKAGFRQVERHPSPDDGIEEYLYRLD